MNWVGSDYSGLDSVVVVKAEIGNVMMHVEAERENGVKASRHSSEARSTSARATQQSRGVYPGDGRKPAHDKIDCTATIDS
jgi:hypothetical protein